ncbi:MAG: hypothetical protein AB8G05_20275 [Oligoflexales bacterium]
MNRVSNRLTLKQNMLVWLVSYGLSIVLLKVFFVQQYEILFGVLFFGLSVLLMLAGLWGVLLAKGASGKVFGWGCLLLKLPVWLYVFWVVDKLEDFSPEFLVVGCLYGLILTGAVWGWGGYPQKTASKGLCK